MKSRASLGLALGFVLVGAVLGLWLAGSTPEGIKEQLRFLSPRAAEVAFLLLLAGAGLSAAEIRDSLPSKSFFYPLAAGVLAFLAVALVSKRARQVLKRLEVDAEILVKHLLTIAEQNAVSIIRR